MNNNQQALDLSDVSSFDDNDNIGLTDNSLSQKTENKYQLSDSEDFSDYITRTSSPSVPQDNEVVKYLKSQGRDEETIKGTTIPTDDGEVSIFDLNKKQQKELVQALKNTGDYEDYNQYEDTIVETDDNIEALIEAYQNGGLDSIVELIKESGLIEDSFDSKVANLSDEEVLVIAAKQQCRDCDDDHIDDLIENLKRSASVKNILKSVRTDLIAAEKQEMEYRRDQDYKDLENKRQEGKAEFKKTVSKLTSIYDFDNDADFVNEISDYVYSYDEDYGTSEFLRDITTDPELRYKVAFFAKYGDQMIDNYKQEIKKAFQDGKKSVLNILPSKPKHSLNYSTPTTSARKQSIPDISDI